MIPTRQYLIYGKEQGERRFLPIDLGSGEFVTKLIYATLLTKEEAERVLSQLNEENPSFIFEIRHI